MQFIGFEAAAAGLSAQFGFGIGAERQQCFEWLAVV